MKHVRVLAKIRGKVDRRSEVLRVTERIETGRKHEVGDGVEGREFRGPARHGAH